MNHIQPRFLTMTTLALMLAAALLLSACNAQPDTVAQTIPTDTLAPIVSLTPRYTATLIPTRTPSLTPSPIPSDTPIPPTPTVSPTATSTPPITGSVFSMQAINMRTGPGLNFDAVVALPPGTGFTILGTNNEGTWYNIRLDNGDEGWVTTTLVRLQDTATPFPSLTPTPNLTLLAEGSPLPTSILGGGTITPTPPRSVVSPTPITTNVPMVEVGTTSGGATGGGTASASGTSGGIQLPNVEAIYATATALAGGVVLPTNPPTSIAGGPTGGPLLTGTPTVALPGSVGANPGSRQGVDVLAYCDNTIFGEPPPRDLTVGSTIDIWWRWIATTHEQVQQHIDSAIYDVKLDGIRLDQYRQFSTGIVTREDGQYQVDWLVPSPPLPSGTHVIDYSVTWRTDISDGVQTYGPNSAVRIERGTCTFTVQ